MKLLITSLLGIGSALAVSATPRLQDAIDGIASVPKMLVASTAEAPEYQTTSAEVGDVVKTVMATGALIPALNVEVGSVLSGQIKALRVDFNSKVVKGQVLAELDDRSYVYAADASRAALDVAKADVKGAEARLERISVDARLTELQRAVLATRVDSARSLLDVAERENKRKAWLQERGAGMAADALDSISKREAATATLREAQAVFSNQSTIVEASQADLKKARADLMSARATVTRLEAQLQSALIDLERTKIRSPVDGVIVGRSVTEGQTLATSLEAKTLFTIAGDLGHMDINVRVDESDIAKIKVSQSATFTVDAFPGRTFNASVRQIRIAPQVLQNVVTYTVVLTTANPENILLPGMTVLAKIVTQKTPAATTVPVAALRFRPKHEPGTTGDSRVASLWVLPADGVPKRVPIVRGDDDGSRVVVKSGDLAAGDRIIVGSRDVKSGARDR